MSAQREATYISDLTCCTPAAALASAPRKFHWQTIPYEAEGVAGTMLVAGVECNAPILTLPLELKGWHAISVGQWTHWVDSMIKLKLRGDPCFTPIAHSRPGWQESNYFANIQEDFWKFADLTDQDLFIAQMSTGVPRRAGIAYLKLEPLNDAEVEKIQRDQERSENKRLIAYNDAWSYIYCRAATTREEILEEVEPFRNTDFQKLLWGTGKGSRTVYLSAIGELAARDGIDDFQRVGDRHAAESFRTLRQKGIDPLATVIEYAHEIGLELHGSYRVGGWISPPPEDEENEFYHQHPQWRCVDRDGRPITRMSYAFAGVSDFVISILREVAQRGADGVNLAFVRGLPCVLYEQPLVDGFQQQYGQDPRELPEDDPGWLAYRATWITKFMRALRQEMDQVGQQQGRRVQVSAYVLNDVSWCLSFGLDVQTWAREGLVDFIIANPWQESLPLDVAAFVELARGTACQVYAEMLPRQMAPEVFRKRALDNYQTGVDGLAFWDADTENRLSYKDQWSMLRRLGHREELADWAPDEWPSYRQIPLYSLGGHILDRYSPYWAS